MISSPEKFWSRVDARSLDECWPWTGPKDKKGYGYHYEKCQHRAHRLAWSLANKLEIPVGMMVCHACDNPRCCNPAHLWLGTAGDNQRDCVAKGRKPTTVWNTGITHCKRGHEFTPENTYYRSNGWRKCKTCKREQALKDDAAFRARRAARLTISREG